MHLYELTAQYREALAEIEAAEGETTDELEARLDAIDDAWQTKAESCAKAFKNLAAEADALKAEEKRLYDRRRSLERQAERLKGYIFTQMLAYDQRKLKTPLFTMYIQKGRPLVDVQDINILPPEWVETTLSARKADILKHFKETGEVLPGTQIADSGESLVIR